MEDRDAFGAISEREPAEEANRNERPMLADAAASLSRCAMIDWTRPENSLFSRSSRAISLYSLLRTTTTLAQTCIMYRASW